MKKNYGFHLERSYTELPEPFYAYCNPLVVASPKMIVLNSDLAKDMGLDFAHISLHELAQLFSGNELPDGIKTFAQAYSGHQFGHFTHLGDGRALMWGEHITPKGQRFDIQFKGSGPTPYSRRGDGRAALGPMLREYIISEAMYSLGISSTRSLAVVATGHPVVRETLLPGAVLTRIASSHIRVGTFEFAAAQGDITFIQSLLDYTIKRHYPFLEDEKSKALKFIEIVMDQQINLIVEWMRVGFIHGVMNTDNMTVSGETIDYGPCAFMDAYHPHTVFSSIDHSGRYAYGNQPKIAKWNIAKLAITLLPLIHHDPHKAQDMIGEVINRFSNTYQQQWLQMMRAKIGLSHDHEKDEELISNLLKWMEKNDADYTNTFIDLMEEKKPEGKIYAQKSFEDWYYAWKERRAIEATVSGQCFSFKDNINPVIIPRNHKVEEALEAAYHGDLKKFHRLLEAIKSPYKCRNLLKSYTSPPTPSERVYQTFCGT
ncbi:MAG: YdiU family protein [Alphaproteobacteria bacterium]|nr:YdiU family protein [Alphaproteobacteria bacterium]